MSLSGLERLRRTVSNTGIGLVFSCTNYFTETAGECEMIKCMVCGEDLLLVNWTHLRRHGITVEEYREKFPLAPLKAIDDYVLPSTPTDVEIAYLAGIIDGEGSLGCYDIGPRLTISNNCKELMSWIRGRFGGVCNCRSVAIRFTLVYVHVELFCHL